MNTNRDPNKMIASNPKTVVATNGKTVVSKSQQKRLAARQWNDAREIEKAADREGAAKSLNAEMTPREQKTATPSGPTVFVDGTDYEFSVTHDETGFKAMAYVAEGKEVTGAGKTREAAIYALRTEIYNAIATPILKLTPNMSSEDMSDVFRSFEKKVREGARSEGDKISIELGRGIREADIVRAATFTDLKTSEDRKKQLAHKAYQEALRAAKGAYDRAVAEIEKDHNTAREISRGEFNAIANPISDDLKERLKVIADVVSDQIRDAFAEVKPLIEAARKREDEKRAEAKKAKEEADKKTAERAAPMMEAIEAAVKDHGGVVSKGKNTITASGTV